MTPEQFLQFAELFPDATLLLAKDGTVLAANRAVSLLARWPSGLSGRRLTDFTATPPDALLDYLGLCARSQEPVVGSVDLLAEEGQTVSCRCYGSAIAYNSHVDESRVLLRLTPKDSSSSQLADLNKKVEELTDEVRRSQQVEEQLRNQSRWFSVTLSSVGDAVITTDEAGAVTFLNPVAEALTGWNVDEAKGRPLDEVFRIINEQTRQTVENPVHRVLREGTVVGLANHTVLIAKDGREIPVDDSGAPIRDEAGHVAGVVLIFRDVTERKAAERDLYRQREWLRVTLTSIGDGVITTDTQGRVTFLNPVAENLTGWTHTQAEGQPLETVFRIVNEYTHQTVENPVARVLREGIVVGLANHTALIAQDGTERPIADSGAPIRDEQGAVGGVVLIFRDVTAERRAEEVRRRLAAIVESSDDAIFSKTLEGTITSWNQGAERLYGYTAEEIVGQPVSVLVPPERADESAFIMDKIKRREATDHFETVRRRKDGRLVDVSVNISPVTDAAGQLVGASTIARDITARKRAERDLRESEERKAGILNTALDCIITIDHTGKIVEFNPAAERTFGYRKEDVLGREMAEMIVPPSLRERHYRGLAHYLATGEGPVLGRRIEMPALRADGTELLVELAIVAIRRDGPPLFTAYLRDLTESKRLEGRRAARLAVTQTLAEAATLSEAVPRILESICDALAWDVGAFWRADHEAQLLSCAEFWRRPSAQVAEFEAITRERSFPPGIGLPGRIWTSRQPTWIPDVVKDTNFPRAPIADREGLHGAFGFPVMLGSEFLGIIEFFSREIREPDADLLEMMGTIGSQIGQFIERRRAEAQLRIAEADARFLADASAALASVVDYESTLQKVARLAVPFFADWCAVDMLDDDNTVRRLAVAHVDAAKVELAQDVQRRFPPDPTAPQGVWNIIRTGQSEMIAEISDELLEASAKEAELLSVLRELGLKSYIGVPLSVRGKVLGVLTFITAESGRIYDANDLAVAEDLAHRAAVAIENSQLYYALREADRRKDEFLALLGHELRNPLAPISNALHVLKLPQADEAMRDHAREVLERQIEHMVRLVDDLLDVSRIMRGKVELRREPIELATVVARAVETVQPVIDMEGHQLELSLSPEPLWVHGDLLRLAQVVANLLNNAAKYTEKGGRITLCTAREDGQAVVRVRDTGIGLAPDALPRIFDMFFQAARRTKDAHGGLGIGLSLVRGLVESHGGSVEAHSAGPGMGSEFVVRLPLDEGDGGENRQRQRLDERLVSRRVLVVDDNTDAADSLGMLLRLLGQDVLVAYDGPTALAQAEINPPDVAFVDLGMPRMDGYELARLFRAHPALKDVVLVALTGWGQPEDRQRTKETGFDHHLVKPVEAEALRQLLSEKVIDAP
jgi:PAS domain S-box-containing protein